MFNPKFNWTANVIYNSNMQTVIFNTGFYTLCHVGTFPNLKYYFIFVNIYISLHIYIFISLLLIYNFMFAFLPRPWKYLLHQQLCFCSSLACKCMRLMIISPFNICHQYAINTLVNVSHEYTSRRSSKQ